MITFTLHVCERLGARIGVGVGVASTEFRQRLSIALWRGNARLLLNRNLWSCSVFSVHLSVSGLPDVVLYFVSCLAYFVTNVFDMFWCFGFCSKCLLTHPTRRVRFSHFRAELMFLCGISTRRECFYDFRVCVNGLYVFRPQYWIAFTSQCVHGFYDVADMAEWFMIVWMVLCFPLLLWIIFEGSFLGFPVNPWTKKRVCWRVFGNCAAFVKKERNENRLFVLRLVCVIRWIT